MPSLQRQTLHRLSGQSVPVFDHSHSERFFLCFNFLYFSLCSLSFVLSLDITEKSLDPSSSQYLIRYLYTLTGSFLSPEPFLIQSRQPQLSQPLFVRDILQVLNQLCGPSLDSLQYVHVSLVMVISGLHTALQM